MFDETFLGSRRIDWPPPSPRLGATGATGRPERDLPSPGGKARCAEDAAFVASERRSHDVVCLLGLPFDVLSMPDVAQRVRDAVQSRRRLFLSTPNLNFLITSQSDSAFRASVLDSDLSVADGMPLIWISRLVGTPLPERVTGSGLFERLRDEPLPAGHAPIRVYFFGGPPGAAEAAARRLNAHSSSMVCVGHQSPGFGSVEDLSGPETLDRINASGADFLVVALGSIKGQAWLQRNRARLVAPVISHLGAVVNFEAGTVSRAPKWMQDAGLEWLWRVKEEPGLWRRYGRDACALVGLAVTKLLPQILWPRLRRPTGAGASAEAALSEDGDAVRLCVRGVIPGALPGAIEAAMRQCVRAARPVALDLSEVDHFGPTFTGRLLRLERRLAAAGQPLRLVGVSVQAGRLLRWHGLESLRQRGGRAPAPAA